MSGDAGDNKRIIAVIDDEAHWCEFVRQVFEDEDVELTTINTAVGAAARLREVGAELVLVDLKMAAVPGDVFISGARRIRELRPTLQSRAIIVILSDLHEEGAAHSAALLAQEHEVAVVQVQDPAEVSLPSGGFLRAQEAESGRPFTARARSQMVDQLRIESELRKGGVDHLMLRTDEPYLHKLRHFFRARGASGGGR